jgi:molecular chaperone GrpE
MTTASEEKADTLAVNYTDKSDSAEGSAAAQPSETAEEASAASVPPSDAASGRSMTGEQATPRLAGEAASPSDADTAELKDRLLRVLAEQENFRRRIERERDEAIRFAATQLVKDLLQTADNLARALESVPPDLSARSQEMQNLLTGVAASERALQDTFARHGITQIQPALGEPFDPHQHQAMFELEAADREPGTIAQIVLPGYAYHERLVRPAFVAIAKPDADRPD